MRIERATLRRLWPKAPQGKIDVIASISASVLDEFGIDDPKVVAQLMANISHENGAGTIVRENGNYSAPRIVEIFGPKRSSAKVTPEEAERLQRNPRALFERVYNLPGSPKLAKELGNDQPGDGYNFRGNGDLQLTGRGSHERVGKRIGVDLVSNPEILADPAVSFRVAVAEFVALGCVGPASLGNTTVVRRKVNGGTNGLSEVAVWVRKWEEALPGVEAPLPAPRGTDTDKVTLMGSGIMKSAVGAAGSIVVSAGAKVAENANTTTSTVSIQDVADKVQQASDTITTVSIAKDNALAVVQTVKPFLGVAPNIWAIIAIAALCAAGVAVGFTMWERWKKLRDQGV